MSGKMFVGIKSYKSTKLYVVGGTLIIILCIVLAVVFSLILITPKQAQKNVTNVIKTTYAPLTSIPAKSIAITRSNRYSVVSSVNSKNPMLADIYIKNDNTNDKQLFITTDHIPTNILHIGDYIQSDLYILKQTNLGKEIWKYDSNRSGVKIYSGNFQDFLTSTNEAYIAILETPDKNNTSNILFIDSKGKTLKEITFAQLKGAKTSSTEITQWNNIKDVTLLGWLTPTSNNPNKRSISLWGKIGNNGNNDIYFDVIVDQFNIPQSPVISFDESDKPIATALDSTLDPNTGEVLYSDYSPYIQNSSYTLYDLSLFSNRLRKIVSTPQGKFDPVWINDDAFNFEYFDGTQNKRVTKSLL